MTAPIKVSTIVERGELQRPQKGCQAAYSAALTLLTTYDKFINWTTPEGSVGSGAWLDLGNAPYAHIMVAWTHGATPTLLTLLPVFGDPMATGNVDPTVGAPLPYIPIVTATGVTPAYPQQITFDKANWTTSTTPLSSATVKNVSCIVKTWGQRLMSLYALSDSVTNTPTAVAYVTPCSN